MDTLAETDGYSAPRLINYCQTRGAQLLIECRNVRGFDHSPAVLHCARIFHDIRNGSRDLSCRSHISFLNQVEKCACVAGNRSRGDTGGATASSAAAATGTEAIASATGDTLNLFNQRIDMALERGIGNLRPQLSDLRANASRVISDSVQSQPLIVHLFRQLKLLRQIGC